MCCIFDTNILVHVQVYAFRNGIKTHTIKISKDRLKIPKRLTESENRRCTDNTTDKKKITKRKTKVNTTLN